VLGLMREIIEVGRAEGATLPDELPERIIASHANELRDHWTSIAVDRREGRTMEWQARNAVVGRLGRRHGIPTPLNDALTALLAAADATTSGGT
jgi:2-dehydropantoate 2-reductase